LRLKSLELQGFKSFPDRTKLNIDTGMTVVVGPNGSGKSNISDAIRWVLGELSSKNIRGTKMEDVIFAGTDARRPMGYAEVSLTFDNTVGEQLPIDYDEVTVTRKYYRSGDSEYMINRKPVRLRDITELFMNTGLGKSGYSIIGQGRIAEIISKKSEDRRGIFEEAAGISKYRYKKNEAERKLKDASENLDRVQDILSELEGRVEPLRKDSEKAKKYLELAAQKKEADVSLWLYEIDSVREKNKKLEDDFSIAKHTLEMADDSITALDQRSEKLSAISQENKLTSEEIRRTVSRLTEEKHGYESGDLLGKRDLDYLSTEKTRLEIEIENKTKQGQTASVKLSELDKKKGSADAALSEKELALTENANTLTALRASIAENEASKEALDEQTDLARDALSEHRMELSALDSSTDLTSERRAEIEEQICQLSQRIKETADKKLSGTETLRLYSDKLEESKKDVESYDVKIKAMAQQHQELSHTIDQNTVTVNTVKERMALLLRMEEHFEGYAGSVRFIMDNASKGKLSGICGPVSKVISVDAKYSLAIETALGGNLQNIITDDERAAKAAIALLKSQNAGRSTFYPLNTMRPSHLDVNRSQLEAHAGFVGTADALLQFDEKYRPVISNLLGRTVICDTIDNAADIARKFAYKFRIVTLDGQIINAGGSFTGGSAKRDTGILTRAAEIKKLEGQCATLSEEIRTRKTELEQLQADINDLENKRSSAQSNLDILSVMYNAENTQNQILDAKIEADQKALDEEKEILLGLDKQGDTYRLKKEAILDRIKESEEQIASLQEAYAKKTEYGKTLTDTLDRVIDEKNDLLLALASCKKDLEIIAKESETALSMMASAASDIEAVTEKLRQTAKKQSDTQEKIKENKNALASVSEEIERLQKQLDHLTTEGMELEKQLSDLRQEQKEKARHREIVFREYTRLESALSSITAEQEKYTTRLWDEYELTYSAAKELDYPAVTEENRPAIGSLQNKLRNRIRELGAVNVNAIEEYKEVKERFDFLSKQSEDLTKSKQDLLDIIFKLEKEMRERFNTVFHAINANFHTVFAELFGGGTAELKLTEPDNVLESGIEINVAPPGKIIKSLSLLSGGEQVFVAIALFFAILRVNPAPFCLLDEIEAALDEVNVTRFATYAKRFSDKTQFIVITHRRGTMEEADTMYGVTMQERGISRVLSLNVNEAEQKIGMELK